MILGFTGTRDPISKEQLRWLYDWLDDAAEQRIDVIHHGACLGADAECHEAALDRGLPVVVHPPTRLDRVARECLYPGPHVAILPAKPYLNRNRDIVGASDMLLAMPKKREHEGGGTWYCVQFAQRMDKLVTIVYSDGKIEKRLPRLAR